MATSHYNMRGHTIPSPLNIRLQEKGLGILEHASVSSFTENIQHKNYFYGMQGYETRLEYTIVLASDLMSIDEFEHEMLLNPEYEKMKHIIESNPELKDMYEKYKLIEELKGKE